MQSTKHTAFSPKRNFTLLYLFQWTSHLWFDGAIWVVYWQHRGLSLFEVGLLEALLHLVSLLLDIPMGLVADRIGWKYTLVLSSLAGIGYGLCSLLPFATLAGLTAFALRGLQITLLSGSDTALAYETAKSAGIEQSYQRISGRMLAIQLIGLGMSEALGGWMATLHWSLVYIAFAAANATSAVLSMLIQMPPGSKRAPVTSDGENSLVELAKFAFQFARNSATYRNWILYSAILSGCISMFTFYGQSFLHQSGWSTSSIGVLTAVECFSSAVAANWSTRITRHFGAKSIAFFVLCGMTLFAWVPGIGKGVGYLVTQTSGSAAEPMVDQTLNHVVPSESRATLLSASSTAFSVFMVVGFPLFGLFAGHVGISGAYHITSIGLLFCALLLLFLLPSRR